MGIFNAMFIYLLIWWVMLFTVLPLGVTRHTDAGKGFDAGAPQKADLKRKLIINSVLSAVILVTIEILVRLDIIQWHNWFEGQWS